MDVLSEQLTAVVLSAILVVVVAFQVMLAIGRPWGEWAYGGYHKGVLPRNLRVSSGVAVLVWTAAVLLVLQAGGVIAIGIPSGVVRPAMWTLTVFLGLGTLMNALSKSRKERFLWTPLVAAAFLMCLRLLLGS